MAQTFGAAFGGGIGSGIGSAIAGKVFGSKGKSRLSQSLAQISHQNRVWKNVQQNAGKYGIHPLIALGHQAYQPSPSTVGSGSSIAANAGGNIGAAIGEYVGGKVERRAGRLRQITQDKLALEDHRANLKVKHSEAAKNEAIAQSYISSIDSRLRNTANSQQDTPYIDPDNIPVSNEPAKVQTIPKKGHWIKYLGMDLYMPHGVTAETLEQMYGEVGGSALGIPILLKSIGVSARYYTSNQIRRFKSELERIRYRIKHRNN